MILLLIPYGAKKVAICFIKCVTAALLGPYAHPANGKRLNPPMLEVAITWLFCSTFPFLFPASRSSRNAIMEKKTAVTLTSYVPKNADVSVFQKKSRISEMDLVSLLKPSRVGPVTPELAMRTLMNPSSAVIISTTFCRSSFLVTSP